jgi:hypothetical protein
MEAIAKKTSSQDFYYSIMSAVNEIQKGFQELQEKYRKYFPKADPMLINSILLHKMENPSEDPIFMVEVFTKPGLDTTQVRDYIIEKTGMTPAIYDNGTHYVTSQKLNLEMLNEISDSEDVLEVTGEYTGRLGAYGATHEHREKEDVGSGTRGRGIPPSDEAPPSRAERT